MVIRETAYNKQSQKKYRTENNPRKRHQMNNEQAFEARNENIRHTIDALAEYDPAELSEFGKKSEIIEEHGLDENRMYYVLDQWSDLIEWRRISNSDPLDPKAVQAAYEDETMREMAGIAADGMGHISMSFNMRLDQVFRAIKLLPGDLGMNLFGQVIEQSGDLPRDDLVDALRSFGESED